MHEVGYQRVTAEEPEGKIEVGAERYPFAWMPSSCSPTGTAELVERIRDRKHERRDDMSRGMLAAAPPAEPVP